MKQKEKEFEKIKNYLCNGEQFRKDFPSISREQRIPLTSEEQEKRRDKVGLVVKKIVVTAVLLLFFAASLYLTIESTKIVAFVGGLFGGPDVDYIIAKMNALFGNWFVYPYSSVTTWDGFLNWNNYSSWAVYLFGFFGLESLFLLCWNCWWYGIDGLGSSPGSCVKAGLFIPLCAVAFWPGLIVLYAIL